MSPVRPHLIYYHNLTSEHVCVLQSHTDSRKYLEVLTG